MLNSKAKVFGNISYMKKWASLLNVKFAISNQKQSVALLQVRNTYVSLEKHKINVLKHPASDEATESATISSSSCKVDKHVSTMDKNVQNANKKSVGAILSQGYPSKVCCPILVA